ncbi:ferredoxin--NADP reductase [Halarchaeum salinum]|uniref:FAD-binding FR-type domain-containing protein n=1 Tax=Halarchaeum salinum TaxID=489912 RepID=A0AAV3SA57_9EURY
MTEGTHPRLDEQVEELPLLTDTATVTRVEALDEQRHDEIRRAVHRLLREHGADVTRHIADDGIAWNALEDATADLDLPDVTRKKLRTLRERDERNFPSLVEVAFDPEEPFDFAPGQFVTIRFRGTPRPYSIASSPNAEEMSLCVRRVPGGRLSEKLCAELRPGDELPELRGPNGDFTLQAPSANDMAFLATGTGIAPLRSMVNYVFEEGRDTYEGDPRDIWVFLGASWEDDLAFREEFRALDAAHEHFHFVPCLTRERYLTGWTGETDYVQQTLIKYLVEDAEAPTLDADLRKFLDAEPETDIEARIDPGELEVYACGVSAMVQTLEDVCSCVGVEGGDIRGEGYG